MIVASEGLIDLLLRALFGVRGILTDLVTARAPDPPAIAGRPTPSLYWVCFAFLVRWGTDCS